MRRASARPAHQHACRRASLRRDLRYSGPTGGRPNPTAGGWRKRGSCCGRQLHLRSTGGSGSLWMRRTADRVTARWKPMAAGHGPLTNTYLREPRHRQVSCCSVGAGPQHDIILQSSIMASYGCQKLRNAVAFFRTSSCCALRQP